MTRMKYGTGIVAFFAAIAMAAPASAQSTGAIQWNITDAQGSVVPGTTVTIRNVATGVERSVVSDAAGDYLAPSLAPGPYRIEARLSRAVLESNDAREGPLAFTEKRAPRWTGT